MIKKAAERQSFCTLRGSKSIILKVDAIQHSENLRRENPNMSKIARKLGALATATAALTGSSVIAFATNANSDALNNNDIINADKTGSITVHKYDITAAEDAGAYEMGTVEATGEQDAALEDTLSDFAIQGVVFSYLKVGDVHTYTDGNQVRLVYEVPTALADILGIAVSDVDLGEDAAENTLYLYSDTISNALATILGNGNTEAKNALEAYAAENGATAMDETNASGVATARDLDLGIYLIVESYVPENVTCTTDPFFAQLPFTDNDGEEWLYDLNVYPKNQTGNPTIDKLVKSDETGAEYGDIATASVGDTLDYQLAIKVPTITSDATKLTRFDIVDTISDGLSYNGDAKVAVYSSEELAKSGNADRADAIFGEGDVPAATISYVDGTLSVGFEGDALSYLNTLSDKYITVLYTCNVTDDAILGDVGNENDVQLTWTRTNEVYSNTIEDEALVYTYGLNLKKTFSDENGDFSRVNFVMENTTDGYYLTAEKAEEDGVYYVTGKTDSQENAAVFTPDAEGNLQIIGMEADTYTLVETDTDTGYSLLKDPITIEITGTDRAIVPSKADVLHAERDTDGTVTGWTIENEDLVLGDLTSASATVDGNNATMTAHGYADALSSDNAFVELSVVNSKGFKLPQTGGRGIYAITIIGVMAVAAGGFAYMNSKKKEKA